MMWRASSVQSTLGALESSQSHTVGRETEYSVRRYSNCRYTRSKPISGKNALASPQISAVALYPVSDRDRKPLPGPQPWGSGDQAPAPLRKADLEVNTLSDHPPHQ